MPKTAAKAKLRVERDSDFLANAPEISIFLACYDLVKELRRLERAFNAEELSDRAYFRQFNAVLLQLTAIAAATERFDIVFPVMDYGRFSPFFWRWFNWWDDYLQGLTTRQIGQIERQARQRAVSTHRPDDHWVRYRHSPAFTLVMS